MNAFTAAQIKTIEDAGFKVGNDNKIREGGRLIAAAMYDGILAGDVFASFDMAALKKEKQQKAAKKAEVDLVAELEKISPLIGNMKQGMTIRVKIPEKGTDGKDPKRSFVMSIVTKLNHVTSKGRDWAGRVFEAQANPEGTYVYINRYADTDTPHERKKPTGKKAGRETLAESLERARKHLDGTGSEEQTAEAAAEGEAVVIGESNTGEIVKEDATVVKH